MGIITETTEWVEEIYQLELSDPVKGGEPAYDVDGNPTNGWDNVQAQQLAKRTLYLRDTIASAGYKLVSDDETLAVEDVGKHIVVQNSSTTASDFVVVTLPEFDDVPEGAMFAITYWNQKYIVYQPEPTSDALVCKIAAGGVADRIWNGQFRATSIYLAHGESVILRKELNDWIPVSLEGGHRNVGELVFATTLPPKGAIRCDGSIISPDRFPRLCEFIDGAASTLGTSFVLDDDANASANPGLFVRDTSFSPTRYRLPNYEDRLVIAANSISSLGGVAALDYQSGAVASSAILTNVYVKY